MDTAIWLFILVVVLIMLPCLFLLAKAFRDYFDDNVEGEDLGPHIVDELSKHLEKKGALSPKD